MTNFQQTYCALYCGSPPTHSLTRSYGVQELLVSVKSKTVADSLASGVWWGEEGGGGGGGSGGEGSNKTQHEIAPQSKHACHDFNGKNEEEQGKNKLASTKFNCLSFCCCIRVWIRRATF